MQPKILIGCLLTLLVSVALAGVPNPPTLTIENVRRAYTGEVVIHWWTRTQTPVQFRLDPASYVHSCAPFTSITVDQWQALCVPWGAGWHCLWQATPAHDKDCLWSVRAAGADGRWAGNVLEPRSMCSVSSWTGCPCYLQAAEPGCQ